MNDTITREDIARYADALREQERSENTVKKYVHDLQLLHSFLGGAPLTKSAVIAWKQQLSETRCA